MQQVTLYTKSTCPFCIAAKNLLTELGVEYTDVDVVENPEIRAELSEKHNHTTVPMIFIGEEFIGGFDSLRALHEHGELLAKIQA